jgi:hypothetical protein
MFLTGVSLFRFMKKGYWLFLLFVIACAQPQETLPTPEPVVEVVSTPVPSPAPIIIEELPVGNAVDFIINNAIPPFNLISTASARDNFAIIRVERFDAEYVYDVNVLVHIFRFSSRQELDVVLNSELYDIIANGAIPHHGQSVAVYLNENNHRSALWPSGNFLIYVETFIPNFVAVEIVNAYLAKYPSDLKTSRCIDSDGGDQHFRGTTTRIQIGSTFMEWTDVCLRDFAMYRNKQYKSKKGVSEPDGLLEGRCQHDPDLPGYIYEYACPRGCEDGRCR